MTINFPSLPLDASIYTDPLTDVSYRYSSATNSWTVASGPGTVPVVGVQGPQGIPGGRSAQILTYTTPTPLADLAFLNFVLPSAKIFILLEVQIDVESWLRFYRSSAHRSLDTRTVPGGTFQDLIDLGEARPYAEVVTSTPDQLIQLNPPSTVTGNNSSDSYMRLQNMSGSSNTINISCKVLPLED